MRARRDGRSHRSIPQFESPADTGVHEPFGNSRTAVPRSRRRARRLLTLLLVMAALSSSSSGSLSSRLVAQSSGPSDSHAGHQMSLADAQKVGLAVNGAETPEAVPDDMAYALFFRALASASPRRADRMNDVLAKAGLGSSDRAAISSALGSFSTAMDVVAQQRKKRPVGDPTIRMLEVQALQTARDAVAQSASPAGAMLLDAYVQTHVKPRVKIYRDGGAKEER